MATATKRSASSRKQAIAPRSMRASDSTSTFAQWFSNPAVRYVASGIATAVLAKIATNMADRYPQISQLLREGLETVEGKLTEFNGGSPANFDSEEMEAPVARSSSRSRRSPSASVNH